MLFGIGTMAWRGGNATRNRDWKKPLAVVTMCYDEGVLMQIWAGHYARQVGSENCYVLDHGSADGSTDGLPVHVIRLPRSPFDEHARAVLVSDFCASLLRHHEAVLYTDVDEIVVADPRVAINLNDYALQARRHPVVTVFGMDLLAVGCEHAPLDASRSVMRQRDWLWPHEMLCKPVFVRERPAFRNGFHLCDAAPVFEGLFMFHIAYADPTITRRRQAKRNRSPPIVGGDHHRLEPDVITHAVRDETAALPRIDVDLDGCPAMRAYIAGMRPYGGSRPPAIWRLPRRFRR